jgi:hypothetical protein
MNAQRLSQRLNLDTGQQAQIKPVLDEYALAAKDVIARTPQDVRDRRRDLLKEQREARKARDKEKMKATMQQLKDLRANDPQAQEMIKLRRDTIARIEPVLRDDQKAMLRKMVRLPGRPSLSNPRFLRACVMQLDLRPDQQTELKKINKEFQEALKGLDKDAPPQKRKELDSQYHEEVMKLLDPGQKQQLEEIARKGPEGLQLLRAVRSPKLLDEALKTVNLRPDQQSSIDALRARYQTDRQAAGKDRRAMMALNRKLAEDVLKVLDDEQQNQLMKWRPPKRGPGKNPGKKGRKGASKADQ